MITGNLVLRIGIRIPSLTGQNYWDGSRCVSVIEAEVASRSRPEVLFGGRPDQDKTQVGVKKNGVPSP